LSIQLIFYSVCHYQFVASHQLFLRYRSALRRRACAQQLCDARACKRAPRYKRSRSMINMLPL